MQLSTIILLSILLQEIGVNLGPLHSKPKNHITDIKIIR